METTLQSAILKLSDNKRTLKNSCTVTSMCETKSMEELAIFHKYLGFHGSPRDNSDNDDCDVKSLSNRRSTSINMDSVLIPKSRRDAKENYLEREISSVLPTAIEMIARVHLLFIRVYVGCMSFIKHVPSHICTEKRGYIKEKRYVWTPKLLKYVVLFTTIACIISIRNLCYICLHFCIITGFFKSVKLRRFTSENLNVYFNKNMKTMNCKEYKKCKPYCIENISWLWHIRPRHVFLNVFPSSLKLYFENAKTGTGDASPPMNIEWLRLKSFACVSFINARPIILSRAGFYYTGTSDEVECYSCGIRRSNWDSGDDPADLHRQMSPHCKHVCGTDDTNVPIPRNAENMHSSANSETTSQDINSVSFPVRDSDLYSSSEFPTSVRDDMVQHSIENQHQNRPNTTIRNLDTNEENPSMEQTGNRSNALPENISKQIKQHIPVTSSPTKTRNLNGNSYRRRDLDNGNRIGDNANSQLNTRNPSPTNPSTQTRTMCTHTSNFGSSSVSASVVQKLAPLGVNFDKPKYPAYAVLTVRMSSYSGWTGSQTTSLMAEAGFVYAGYADYTRCFFCGGGLKNWEDGDDPWIEHARWYPYCAYLRQNKGVEFVQLVHERLNGQEQANSCSSTRLGQQEVVGRSSAVDFLSEKEAENLPAFQNVVQQGYSPELVGQAVSQLVAKGIKDIHSSDILEEISRLNGGRNQDNCKRGYTHRGNEWNTQITDTEERELRQLVEENRRLNREKTCRICEEEDASITFLPCAHLVCCQVCAQSVRRCPVCKVIIQGTIKTWLT